MECLLLDMPQSGPKLAVTGALGLGGVVLSLGLFTHHGATIPVGFLFVAGTLGALWLGARGL